MSKPDAAAAALGPQPQRQPHAGLRRALFVAIGLLYVLSVPWYREPGAEPALWLGLPDWVSTALLCYAGAAVLNVIAWQLTDVRDPAADEPSSDSGRR